MKPIKKKEEKRKNAVNWNCKSSPFHRHEWIGVGSRVNMHCRWCGVDFYDYCNRERRK